jgi:anti-anti-sigma factor
VNQSGSQQLVDVEIEWPLPRTVVVRLCGDLDDAATGALEHVLQRQLAGSTPCRLVLDLSRVELLGPAALKLLLRLHRQCRVHDIHLMLVGTGQAPVNRPLRANGLLPLFDARPTVESATRGFAYAR